MEAAQLWESGNLGSGPNLTQIICVTLTMYLDFSLFCFVFICKMKTIPYERSQEMHRTYKIYAFECS